jgi:hypothetical protein
MNCQDIGRIADSGRFSALSESERGAAEAHARTCPHCAPVWAVHARLAEMRMPPMPAELASRVRTLAAIPTGARGGSRGRRLTVIGSIVALAAAAAMIAAYLQKDVSPAATLPPAPVAVASVADVDSAPSQPTPEPASTIAPKIAAAPAPAPEQLKPAPPVLPLLPLLPAPVHFNRGQRDAQIAMALRKAADQHPELVEGPDMEQSFAVAVAIREDGRLISSAVELVPNREELVNVIAKIERTLPTDGGGSTSLWRSIHSLLDDGRMLRADVLLRVSIVSNDYDVTRSNVRVLQILGDKYADQMQPANSLEMKRLTVFLSDDGRILREKIDAQPAPQKPLMGGDTNDAIYLAQSIADRLGMDVAQIGLVGSTTLEDGSRAAVLGSDGNYKPDESHRILRVYYAWPRWNTESGPSFMQSGSASTQSSFDDSAAIRIVEREIPDAFTRKDPAAGRPTVVLTAKGEVIRAGWVNFQDNNGRPMDTILQEQLVPGVTTTSFLTTRLRNNLGDTVNAWFAWEISTEDKAAMEKAKAEWAAQQATAGVQ